MRFFPSFGRARWLTLFGLTLVVVCGVAFIREAGASKPLGANASAGERAALSHPTPKLNLVKVGFHNLGGYGFNGNIAIHGDYAYVGSWGTPGDCPARGVKVVDISDHLNPTQVGVIPIPAGTRASEARVESLSTSAFQGDLLVNSNESCAFGGSNGIQLWDVTDPLVPQPLSRFDTGGVHNLYLYQKNDRAYVLLAVPYGEVFGASGGYAPSDLQVIDVTDPTDPTLAGQWTIGRDAGLAFGAPGFTGPPGANCAPPPGTPALCRGDIPAVYLHDVSVSADGNTAYLSYWDAGLVILDISDPAGPALISVTPEPLADEGNAHSAEPNANGSVVLVADEDIEPGPWGYLRVFDTTNPASPAQVGSFVTSNTVAVPPPDDGWYTIHHPMIDGNLVYAGWYSDGVRVIDLTHPFEPDEIASFVPPDTPDPNGYLQSKALVWAVHSHAGVLFASDMNSGLYVLDYDSDLDGCGNIQETSANPLRGGQRDPGYFWDFIDVPTGLPAARDRAVTIGDIGAIVARFGAYRDPPPNKEDAHVEAIAPPPPAPAYHAAFDRGGTNPAGDLWDLLPPDGAITIGDIGSGVGQFGHTCA